MNKQKSNFLLVIVAIVAIAALVLGAVALNKANMTGNAFWDFFKKSEKTQENIQESSHLGSSASSGACEQPEFDQCVADCKFNGNPDNYDACMQNCGETWCEEDITEVGLLGMIFLEKGGDSNALKGYEVKYDKEGNMIYEITDRNTISLGENYFFQENESGQVIIMASQGGSSGGIAKICQCQNEVGCSTNTIDCYVTIGHHSHGYVVACQGSCLGNCNGNWKNWNCDWGYNSHS